MNKVIIIGNLGQDPEIKTIGSGDGVELCKFSVAVTETYLNRDKEKVSNTTWFNIDVFGKQAKSCAEYLFKGSKVAIDGKMVTSKKDEENARIYWSLRASHVEFLTPKSDSSGSGGGDVPEYQETAKDGDAPF